MKTATKQAGQVYFEKTDYERIKYLAKNMGESFAEFVRVSALQRYKDLQRKKEKNILGAPKTTFSYGEGKICDYAENHDKYLSESR